MLIDGPYTALSRRHDKMSHTGYDYRGKILRNTLSSYVTGKGGMFAEYLGKMDDIYTEMVEQIKSIRVFGCMAADKNERRLP